jgi:hypothetical protein
MVISAAIQDAWVLRKGAAMTENVKNYRNVICQTAVTNCCHIPSLTLHLSQESV